MLFVIGGTTASGKSALALRIAETVGGSVINADSRQVFRDLPILTARPGSDDQVRADHRLYGYLATSSENSVGQWLNQIEPIIRSALTSNQPLVVVGGTGLYIEALLSGLPDIPEVPNAIRSVIRSELAEEPSARIHAILRNEDPTMAARLLPSDRQRILRALEVVRATGRSLFEWQRDPRRLIPLPEPQRLVALLPPRECNAVRIASRFNTMLEAGACDELIATRAWFPNLKKLPLGRASGVSDLLSYLEGEIALHTAIEQALAATRQYAKRQRTWFRHQAPRFRTFYEVGENISVQSIINGA